MSPVPPNIKDILVSILIGACVAFFTALFQGIADAVAGYGNNIAGGIASAAYYTLKTFRV